MTFLQPFLLAALPLIALPVIIHLINQRRYQTVRWAAMMFLLAANRMSRGYARLRQWMILLFRVLALAGLVFAISRPLASGWLGLTAGGQPDTTIILLDRSPSMSQHGAGTVVSKLESGRQQLVQTLSMLGSGRWVLIDSESNTARDIQSPDALLRLPSAEAVSSSADVPAMLEAARDYINANKSGRTEIWLCSDVRSNDWNAESGRWQGLRDSFLEFPQSVRFHLLAYADTAKQNTSVRVTSVRRFETPETTELLVSLKLTRDGDVDGPVSVPVQFEIEGARSQLMVEMEEATVDLTDQRIPIERSRERGWGRVSIPADANPADNDFYFVFDQPLERQTLIVSDDPQSATPLRLAATISPDPTVQCSVQLVRHEELGTVNWDATSLLIWHGALPEDDAAQSVTAFVERGGQVFFLPPRVPDTSEFMGVSWSGWNEKRTDFLISTWRTDQDVLANTQSGTALPVGDLQLHRYCGLEGEVIPLAAFDGGDPLLARVPTNRGGVYFCSTTASISDSSLAEDGVVLYVLVQRALAAGAAVLGQTRQMTAGDESNGESTDWKQVTGGEDALSTSYAHHGGVYSFEDKLVAINRSSPEDSGSSLDDERVASLFEGLDFDRVNDQAGSLTGLIQEIWRLFLFSMLVALLAEAALCMPKLRDTTGEDGSASGMASRSSDSQKVGFAAADI